MMDFNAYWVTLLILVGGMDYWQDGSVTCGRVGMAGSVTRAWSHDQSREWRKCNKSVTCIGMEV